MGTEFEIPIIWQDEHILAIDKPPGLLAIPDGYDTSLPHVKGILEPNFELLWVIHRLDRYTSGVMVLARSAAAHRNLNAQFQERRVKKIYLALIIGDPDWDSITVDQPLSANKGRRKRTVVDLQNGKPSVTHLKVRQRHGNYTLVEAVPQTGRRHQIRAHLAGLGHPVACDSLYGGEKNIQYADIIHNPPGRASFSEPLLKRPGLHARELELVHPATAEGLVFKAPYPNDLQQTMDVLGDHSV
jgi:RluA family pseudouridine synthase